MKIISPVAVLLFLSAAAYADPPLRAEPQLSTGATAPAGSTVPAEPPLQEAEKSDIEYTTPQLAIDALSQKPGAEVTQDANGWTIVYDKNARTLWSFAPTGDPSYPSMVKRAIVEEAGAWNIKMDVRCGGSKEACDHLVRQFIELNQKMADQASEKNGPKPGG